MLIAKIYVNAYQIDEIHIQNTGRIFPEENDNNRTYEIKKPEGVFETIIHDRSKRYKPLLVKALQQLIEKEK